MVGSTLGQYKILEKIGAGGMGEVYRAEDAKLGREVAIKVLPEGFTNDPERLARFEREAQAVAALSHPNILSIFDFGTENGVTYAVMELLDGDSLRHLVAAGPIPIRKSLDYARQMADGLAAAHEKGIIHRDLKPDNLFVSRDGRVKILDFGLARQTSLTGADTATHSPTLAEATEAGAVLGTVGYMSPEQVKGDPADARSDIFSLGLVLYEMLAGQRAYERETGAEIMTAILREDPPDLTSSVANLPPTVDRLVRHCLEKRPEERFQSARDLSFDLEAMTGFSTTGVVPKVGIQETSKGKRRWIAAALGAALLIGTHFAVYRLALPSAAPPSPEFQRLTFQRGSLSGARFSPDGQTVVYSASWQGSPLQLYSTRLDSPESKSLGLPSANLWSISSKGELAIGLDPLLTLWSFGRLASVPLLGGAPRELAGPVSGADWTQDGQTLVITNAFRNRGNLESPPGNVVFEASGRLTYPRISPDGQSIAVCHHPTANDTRGQIIVVDWQGNSTTLSSFYSDLRGVDWSPDGNEVWFTAKGDSLSANLRAVSLAGMERIVYSGVGDVHLQDVTADGRVLLERYNGRWETAGRGSDDGHDRDLSIFEWTLIRDVSLDGKTVLLAETGDATGEEYATYLRATDGSPPIRLGIGVAQSLSPSGRWALARSADGVKLFLYPTGAGQSRTIELEGITGYGRSWLLDDDRALINASFQDEDQRGYLLDLATSDVEPVTEPGISARFPTPDGRFFVKFEQGSPVVVALDGGETWTIQGVQPDDIPIDWAADGHSMYVLKQDAMYPVPIFLLNTRTGERELFLEFEPPDRAGTGVPTSYSINPDGTAWAFSYPRIFSELHLVEGLK